MKNILKIALHLIIISALFISCNTGELETDQIEINQLERIDVDSPQTNNTIDYENLSTIGVRHNELIIDFLQSDLSKANYNNSQSLVKEFYEFSMKNNPELKEYKHYYDRQLKGFNVALKGADIFANFKVELNDMLSNGEISEYMYSNLMLIIDNPSLDETYALINEIEKNPNLTTDEENGFLAFKNVLSSSKELWSKDRMAAKADSCSGVSAGEMAIIGDAIGGAMWWWTGPAGALIAGGYSLAMYNSGCSK